MIKEEPKCFFKKTQTIDKLNQGKTTGHETNTPTPQKIRERNQLLHQKNYQQTYMHTCNPKRNKV